MSNGDTSLPGRELPDPAREALDEPHLNAEELKREIGDSEAWDEASEDEHQHLPRPDTVTDRSTLRRFPGA